MEVVHGSLACRYELLANPDWYGEICQTVSMKMTDFTAPDMEESHVASIDIHSDVRP
jgi:hypothetical protein